MLLRQIQKIGKKMFCGIVQTCGKISLIKQQTNHTSIEVIVDKIFSKELAKGASIAINGVCLTVTSFRPAKEQQQVIICFDIIAETLKLTNLSLIKISDKVNFERSLKIGDEIGGHIVSGHILTTAKITKTGKYIHFSINKKWKKYLYPKTYITVDGISLTITEVSKESFQVSLIPETKNRTTLAAKKVGSIVNIEFYSHLRTIVDTIATMAPDQASALKTLSLR
jgi:riboflavin synthase